MHSQQNSQPHTAHVMWLQLPSFILMMYALQRGHGLMSSAAGEAGMGLDECEHGGLPPHTRSLCFQSTFASTEGGGGTTSWLCPQFLFTLRR